MKRTIVIVAGMLLLVAVLLIIVLTNIGRKPVLPKSTSWQRTEYATSDVPSGAGIAPTPHPLMGDSTKESEAPSNPALIQARKDFPHATDEELETDIRHGVNLKMIKEEKVSKFEMQAFNLGAALQEYRDEFGEYPKGGEAEIGKALLGNNPKKMPFFTAWPSGQAQTGELLDPWGVPFKIQISRNKIEIRSAGPDRIFGNPDDQIVRK